VNEIKLTIPGAPIAKKRPRFFRRGKYVGTYNAQETEEGKFMQLLMAQLNGHQPIAAGAAVFLDCAFFMPVPKTMRKKDFGQLPHVKKPDLDNLVKFVKDCANGILWADDAQVVYVTGLKAYAWLDSPRTEILVRW